MRQTKAIQVFQAAHRQGHMRLATIAPGEASVTAHTFGAAFVAIMRWLWELRWVGGWVGGCAGG